MVYAANTADATSTHIWTVWNASYSTTAATTMVNVAGTVWNAWNQSYLVANATTAAITTATNGVIWDAWTDGYAQQVLKPRQAAAKAKQATAEQQAQWKREDEARKVAAEAARQEIEAAKGRAEVLLLRHLSPEQREDLKVKGCFYVEVDGMKYRVNRGSHNNVHLIGEQPDQIRKTFCIQPRGVPDGDAMLAQKLMLETDPEAFWKKAHVQHHDPAEAGGRKDNVIEFRRVHKRAVGM